MNIKERYKDNAEELGMAVVHFACKDYMLAYKSKNTGKMKAIEEFFHSDYFVACSMGKLDGDYLVREIKRKIDKNQLKKMNRSLTHGLYESKPGRIKKADTDQQELFTDGMDG